MGNTSPNTGYAVPLRSTHMPTHIAYTQTLVEIKINLLVFPRNVCLSKTYKPYP